MDELRVEGGGLREGADWCSHLFDILHLLAEALQFRFGVDHPAGHFGGVCFRPDGVAFAEHFLGEEVEGAAVGLFCPEAGGELFEVAFEAAEFFGDIGTVGEERQLAGQTFVVGGE